MFEIIDNIRYMKNFIIKFKNTIINSFIILIFSVALFFLGFYLVNFDFNFTENINTQEIESPITNDIGTELKQKMGSTTFSVESYDDWAKRFNLPKKEKNLDKDSDNDKLPNYLEYVHGTDPLKDDSDSDGFSDWQEINNGYDPYDLIDKSSRLATFIEIDKLNVYVPMIWSKSDDEKDMLLDLENGVNHFVKTASPGQNGNMVISGHSSNYAWAKGNYNHIFEKLNDLEKGDSITVKTMQKNGRIIVYHYVISDKFITTPENQDIFAQTEDPSITLSTCWPLGTNLKRVIIKASLAK